MADDDDPVEVTANRRGVNGAANVAGDELQWARSRCGAPLEGELLHLSHDARLAEGGNAGEGVDLPKLAVAHHVAQTLEVCMAHDLVQPVNVDGR